MSALYQVERAERLISLSMEVATDREVVTPPRKKVREEVEETPNRIREAPSTKFPPTVREGCGSTSQGTTAKKATAPVLQECGRRRLAQSCGELRHPLGC